MVTFVWWILSLFSVCEFTWLPIVIDTGLTVLNPMNYLDDSDSGVFTVPISAGICLFATCKHWFSLTISGWWVLLSPVWFLIAFILPGGFTLTNYLLGHFGLMTVPGWVFITGIVVDVICVILELVLIFGGRSKK